MSQDLEKCRSVLKKRCSELLAYSNVVATGVGYKVTNGQTTDQLCIICSVVNKKSSDELGSGQVIPRSVDGVVTDVIETGLITAQADPKNKFRPAPGGVSIGHVDITAGTLGCYVRKNGELMILSNNHVLANSNDASIGDPILQPGPTDGGTNSQDRIATLESFVPIVFPGGGGDGGGDGGGGGGGGGCRGSNSLIARIFGGGNKSSGNAPSAQMDDNLVDAALGRLIDPADIDNTILDIGPIQGSAEGTLGMSVKKYGRTTEFTTSSIQQIDAVVDVSYGAGLVARFTDQLIAGAMSQGGDSGSAVLNNNDEIVGLLFAGSSTSTILNRIQNVFSALGVTL